MIQTGMMATLLMAYWHVGSFSNELPKQVMLFLAMSQCVNHQTSHCSQLWCQCPMPLVHRSKRCYKQQVPWTVRLLDSGMRIKLLIFVDLNSKNFLLEVSIIVPGRAMNFYGCYSHHEKSSFSLSYLNCRNSLMTAL